MIGPLTYVDAALLTICFISGILAMYRGFSREILSIVSWIVAGGAGAYFFLYQKKLAEDVSQQMGLGQPLIAQIGLAAVVFLITLIIVHLITSRISDSILDSRVGVIDRILGLGFGVARGLIIIVVGFMLYLHFEPERAKQVEWVSRSKSYDLLLATGQALKGPLSGLVERVESRARGDQRG
jgi:membrane protein required for colicin V production